MSIDSLKAACGAVIKNPSNRNILRLRKALAKLSWKEAGFTDHQRKKLVEYARGCYETDDLEFDDCPDISDTRGIGDDGVWISCWQWFYQEEHRALTPKAD